MNTLQWVTNIIKERGIKRFAEIGVLNGQLAKGVLESCPMELYLMVEREINDSLKSVFSEMSSKSEGLLCMESIMAASLIADGSLDMVYVDAGHGVEDVSNDIRLWSRKVREGGILCGHDYNPDGGYGVHRAVNALVNGFSLQPDDASEGNNIWWVMKNGNTLKNTVDKPLYVNDFRRKKLVEYLEPGMKVLIRFGHGWGDTQMFYPIYDALIDKYKDVHFDLYVECGQERIFKSYPTKESEEHDLVFSLDFPMAEGSILTKADKCCMDEIGIEAVNRLPLFTKFENPLVLCHFQGTALPNSVNCPEGVAQQVWGEIIEAGKIPMECHFEHVFHNPVNAKYGFIDSTVRRAQPTLASLIGLIQNAFAFIGVASGPLITALAINPKTTLFLERNHKIENYVKFPVVKMDVMNYEKGRVKRWLESLIASERM